jgi:hypothetical protein
MDNYDRAKDHFDAILKADHLLIVAHAGGLGITLTGDNRFASDTFNRHQARGIVAHES